MLFVVLFKIHILKSSKAWEKAAWHSSLRLSNHVVSSYFLPMELLSYV